MEVYSIGGIPREDLFSRHQRNKAATETRFMRLELYLNRTEVDEEEAEKKRT